MESVLNTAVKYVNYTIVTSQSEGIVKPKFGINVCIKVNIKIKYLLVKFINLNNSNNGQQAFWSLA